MTDNDTAASTQDAARDFRAALEHRREAEDIMATALAARQHAATYADELVRHAETLAKEIEEAARDAARGTASDARARAEHIISEAHREAARVTAAAETSVSAARVEEAQAKAQAEASRTASESELAQARREIEQMRADARAEIASQRTMAYTAIDDHVTVTVARLASSANDVQVVLERASADLAATLAPLDDFRTPLEITSTFSAGSGEESREATDDRVADRRRNPFRSSH